DAVHRRTRAYRQRDGGPAGEHPGPGHGAGRPPMTPLPAPAPRQRGRGLAPWLVMTTLAGLGGCSRAGGIGVAERDAGHPSGLGARPETFGVSGGDSPGSRRWASGFEVRWEPVGKVPRVVGIAELWGGPG